MKQEQLELIISSETLAQRVSALGKAISQDSQERQLLVIGVLKGAFVFMADLVRSIDLDLQLDFIRVSSYGNSTNSSGTIELVSEPSAPIAGRHILLVEDIVDSGLTLHWLRRHFLNLGAASVQICCLIDKSERREQDVQIDYAGFAINHGFLVGYGLDCDERYRNLTGIYHLNASD